MKRGPAGAFALVLETAGAAGRSIAGHWALAAFSLVAAFGIWVAIQDVDNPRVAGLAPSEGGIQVEVLNIPDGYLVDTLQQVTVRVEARKGDLETLRPSDFRAFVDAKTETPGAEGEGTRPVRVESRRKGVDVLEVKPAAIPIRLIRAAEKQVPVTVRQTTPPPGGFSAEDLPTALEPAIVTVRGRQELVDTVATVDLDANLGTARGESVEVEGDLVARTLQGNPVQVSLSQRRARATFKITQLFSLRSIGVLPIISGSPERGYFIANVTVDPPVVQITGPKSILDGLKDLPLSLETLDVTGAKASITLPRAVKSPPNVSTDRQTVIVRVEIQALDCSGTTGPCQAVTLFLAPVAEALPPGLSVEPGSYSVQVRISGPLPQLATLRPSDLRATISFAGATAGTASYVARVTAPAGVRVESVEPIVVTLRPVAGVLGP